MGTIHVRLDEETERYVREEAARLGLRRSDIVRLALRQMRFGRPAFGYTAEQIRELTRSQPVGRERYERVRDLIGSVDSGVGDLGTEHEKHLWEMFDDQGAGAVGHRTDRGGD